MITVLILIYAKCGALLQMEARRGKKANSKNKKSNFRLERYSQKVEYTKHRTKYDGKCIQFQVMFDGFQEPTNAMLFLHSKLSFDNDLPSTQKCRHAVIFIASFLSNKNIRYLFILIQLTP